MAEDPAVETFSVTKYYPAPRRSVLGLGDILASLRGLREEVLALDRLDLRVRSGQIFGLLGPNGAGKTTLCKIMNAVVLPTKGHVEVFGMETIQHHRKITRKMVTIFGGELAMYSVFHPRLSCERNLRYLADLWKTTPSTARRKIDLALGVVGLEEKKTEWYQKLSGGQKQRLLLAIPFLLEMPLIVLDEPTIRIDVKTRRTIYASLRELLVEGSQATVLLTTHNIDEIEKVCDHVAVIDHGRIIAQGRPRDIVNSVGGLDRIQVHIKLSPERCTSTEEGILAEAQEKGLVVSSVEEDEGYLSLVLDPAEVWAMGLGPVISSLSRLGVVESVETRRIDLEEAFLKLTEHNEGD